MSDPEQEEECDGYSQLHYDVQSGGRVGRHEAERSMTPVSLSFAGVKSFPELRVGT